MVRECRENATGHVFMAKIVPYDQETKKSILQEYEILKSLHHDKVMTLHEAYVTPRYLVLVAEYCTGKELLHSLIDRCVEHDAHTHTHIHTHVHTHTQTCTVSSAVLYNTSVEQIYFPAKVPLLGG